MTPSRRFVTAVHLILLVACATPAWAQQPSFPVGRALSGSITCRIETTGSTTNDGYAETQVHTWTLTGAAPQQVPNNQVWIHPARWSATGQGHTGWKSGGVQIALQYDNWTIAVTPRDAPIAIRSRPSDNRLVVELWHSPSQAADAVNGTLSYFGGGADSAPRPYKEALNEAPLTVIEADRTAGSLTGSSSATLTGNFATRRQGEATNVQVRETCSWSIAPGSPTAPLPPPPPISGKTPADGPWTGQAQCVLTATGPTYQDEQVHTWRLTGEPPALSGAFRQWPAMWSVRGKGSRQIPVLSGRAAALGAAGPSESWTIDVPETKAPISIWQLADKATRLRIGSQHGVIVAYKALNIRTRTATGAETQSTATLEEWVFPVAEDEATLTTISGKFSRPVRPGFSRGWRQPADVVTTETCAWSFTRGDSAAAPVELSSRRDTRPALPALSSVQPPQVPATTGNAPIAAPSGSAGIIGGTGGATLIVTKECTTTGPAATASAITPGSVTLKWPALTGATNYSVARKDVGVITPAPITALTYTHSAPLDYHNQPYQYSVTAFFADGACATTNVMVTAPRPITPKVTPTVTAGEQASRVNLKWTDQIDLPSGYLVLGPGLHENGAEIEASRTGQTLDIDRVPAGDHTWLVLPFWRTTNGTISDVSLAARVTATVGLTAGRYQIFISGFRVNNQTTDDPLNRDGWLDEVYAAAAVVKWEGGAVKTNDVIKSWVYGDANSSDRIRAGSGSGNGGLKAGDAVPNGWSPSSTRLPPESDPRRFPLKLWEGTLRDGEIVSVRPTLWEFDGDSGAYEYWRAWVLSAPGNGGTDPGLVVTKIGQSPLYQFITAAQYENEGELIDDAMGSGKIVDFRRFDDGMKKTAARFFPGKDRIIGLDSYQQDKRGLFIDPGNTEKSTQEFDFSKIYWMDRKIAFTRAKLDAALTTATAVVIPISLVDEDHSPAGPLHGDYTLYLQVQRIP